MFNAPRNDPEPRRFVRPASDAASPLSSDLEAIRPAMRRSASAVLRRREDVEDAVQEAMLRIVRNPPQIESSRGSLAAFACTTVRRVALDMAMKRQPQLSAEPLDVAAKADDPGAPLDAAHVKGRLSAAVDALGDSQRIAFLLVHQEGLSHPDAARELRISQETLRARLYRARCQLRNALKDLRP